MPKMKAGTLKPAIDEVKKTLQEKADSLSENEARSLRHRVKRMQRKARSIHVLDSAAVLDLHQIECENFQVIQDSIFEPSDKSAILAQKEEALPFPEF